MFDSIPGFVALTSDERLLLENASSVLTKTTGELLIRVGDEVTRYYMILQGTIALSFLKPNGKRYIVRTYESGSLLFLSQALAQTRFSGYLEVLVDAQVIALPAAETWQLLKSNPLFAQSLLNCLVNDNLSLTDAISGFLVDGRGRLCRFLFHRALEAGSRCEDGIRFDLGEPKSRLASRLDMSPETLSRIFAQLKDEAIIDMADSAIVVRKVRDLVMISEGL